MSLRAEEIYATFNVEARRHADLAFTTTGIVGKVYVDIASAVKKDAVLASLENSDAKASLEIAKTALRYAKRDYERQLKVKKLVDEAKFDKYVYKYEHAKAQVALLLFRYHVDGDAHTYTGTIARVYPYADSDNRKLHAEVEVEGFTPGLFGTGYIIIPETKYDI